MPMHYIETGSTDPCFNLAFEEFLLENRREGDWLMLWQNDNTIVIGRNQNTAEEINAEFVREHRITVVRRMTGGGAVYHDLGNLNYSFITDAGDRENLSIEKFSLPVCRALEGMGLNACIGGRNDIEIDGKKVSGVAQRISGNRILHHGTLLFRSDPEMIAGALKPDPEKFSSKSAKSVRSRIGNISDFLPEGTELSDFVAALRMQLLECGAVTETLSEEELAYIRRLAEEKYASWDWTYGKSPRYTFRNRKRFAGGSVEVRLDVDKGIIKDAAFSGDFLALTDCDSIVKALTGLSMEPDTLRSALEKCDIASVFCNITVDELLSLMS